ncbi:MAG: insulinase family protein [Chitinophagaceae bacterium]|nr:insulinase family protein [Chitinophagaceae bacterium]MCW5904188.1 insulinase family protein [Chitinophagaceae bacterium]
MQNRTQAPNIFDAVEFDVKLNPYQHFTLDNGVSVYTIDGGTQEVLQIEFVFYAGNWHEEKNIVAATTNYLLKNGTKNKNAFAIDEYFAFYGAYLNRYCYNETSTITLHSLSKNLPHLLPVIAELFTESIFPEDELAIYKKNQQQRLQIKLKKCDFVANRLIDEYIYGIHHPYGKYTSTLDYNALERDELIAFYNQYYTQGKCLIFIAGKLPTNIQGLLNTYFGNIPFNPHKTFTKEYHIASADLKKQFIVNDENGVQGAIRIARNFPNKHHPDYTKAQVLNNILGGFFGSHLMKNIREDKGYTYGIHSFIQNHIHDTAWMISTEAGRDVCEATIDETYKEMNLLRNELVTEEELHLVKNFMIGSLLGTLDGPFQVMPRWRNYILNNLDETFFYNSIQTIKNITAEEIQTLAKKYLNPEDFYELTVI